jgi:hypothetical protein
MPRDARLDGLQPGEQRLGAEAGERIAPLEVLQVLGAGRHAEGCGWRGLAAVAAWNRDLRVASARWKDPRIVRPRAAVDIIRHDDHHQDRADVEGMRIAGRLASEVLDMLTRM